MVNLLKNRFLPIVLSKKISDLNPLFAGVPANDSKDLINFMLETLHNELNQHRENSNSQNAIINQVNEKEVLDAFRQEYYSKNQSSIVDNFYGITETTSLCLGCKTAKYNFQIYSFLEFPLLEAKKYTLASRTQNPKWLQLTGAPTQDNIFKQTWDNYTLTLEDCLEYYRKIDLMNGQNQMYCNICNGNQDACYGTKIYSAPETLIINLNRGKGAVHQIPIQIPATLNLRNYITDKKNDGEYYLSGIVTHFGPSNMGGHFIAHYRDNALDDSWVKYNDGIVTPNLSTQKVLTIGMPYILFYSKKKPMKPLQNRINTPYSQGLNNIGFTCYMNSAVQLLSHIKPISEYILQVKENNR